MEGLNIVYSMYSFLLHIFKTEFNIVETKSMYDQRAYSQNFRMNYKTDVIFHKNHHKASSHADDVPHIAFDYHNECRGGNVKNLEKLKRKLLKPLVDFGIFHSCNYGEEIIK